MKIFQNKLFIIGCLLTSLALSGCSKKGKVCKTDDKKKVSKKVKREEKAKNRGFFS